MMRFQDGGINLMEKEVSGISRRFALSELRPEILRMALGTFRVYQANTNTDGTLCLRYEARSNHQWLPRTLLRMRFWLRG